MTQITTDLLHNILHPRPEDGHKGTFGHALLIAGKYGMAGASVLAAEACMRSGVGKLTVHIPERNNDILQIRCPEAILHHDPSPTHFTTPVDLSQYDALCIGPGLGTHPETAEAVVAQLKMARECGIPTIVDADALNILSLCPENNALLPQGAIITPHVGEYKRLEKSGFKTENTTFVMKGHPSTITFVGTQELRKVGIQEIRKVGTQEIRNLGIQEIRKLGTQEFSCPFGNDGMATAGSGDVLSGIILGFLAQGYNYADAAILGVSLHAISGDLAAKELGHHSMIASDIIRHLGKAFSEI